MIKVIAEIELYKGIKMRQTPFKSGYRPLFNFIDEMKTSGHIVLDSDFFYPGEKRTVEINFLNTDYLGDDFAPGKEFTFDEGGVELGKGVVLSLRVL